LQESLEEGKEYQEDNGDWITPSVDHESLVKEPPLKAKGSLSFCSNDREPSI